jgi:predicted P-loop ATPase
VAAVFVSCWGAPDTPYSRAVGRYTWSALAGRVMRPGCKADMAPILVGGQGLRKTSGVRAMSPVPEAFVELDFDTSDKELAYKIRGKLVGELGEMRGMSNRQVEDTKTWLTRETEEWREVFQRRQTRFARRLIVVGTGNRNDLLIDETGNRRWLPMTVSRVDDTRILAERDQLWAEGRALFCSNNHTVDWYEAQHLATDIHGDFRVHDVWEDAITAWLLHGEDMDGETGLLRGSKPFATLEVMVGALNFRADGIKQADQRRAAVALRNLGYEYKNLRVDGKVGKRWIFASSEHEEFC